MMKRRSATAPLQQAKSRLTSDEAELAGSGGGVTLAKGKLDFVKVVQRVPVLVRLEPNSGVELRPGMSADVTVRTH